MKKFSTTLLVMIVALSLFGLAPAAYAAPSKSVAIKAIKYKNNGNVEVDFKSKVVYKNSKVTVKDSGGKSYSVKATDRDDDDIEFRVNSIVAGKTYTFTISGIKSKWASSYTSISGKFSTPKAKTVNASVTIKKVEYDADDKELSVDFAQKVKYKNVKATVKDSTGKVYSSWITEKDNDDLEIRVSGLKYGKTYTVYISGVSNINANSYVTVSKTFVAWDD